MANYTLSTLPTRLKVGDTITMNYTGAVQSLDISAHNEIGVIKIECWGGGGQHNAQSTPAGGGRGGYTVGELDTKRLREIGNNFLYCLVGGYASQFNGGGGGSKVGGGATDVRTDWTGGSWNNNTSLNTRLIVAGGGGATAFDGNSAGDGGGFGGSPGNIGVRTYQAAGGGSQTSGGIGAASSGGTDMSPVNGNAGTFGTGGSAYATTFHGGGGGGGWYGGGGGVSDSNTSGNDCYSPGGGGSSYIAGHPSCPKAHPNQIILTNGSTTIGANPMGADGKIVMTILTANVPPNAPSNLTPEGIPAAPAMLKTLTPTFTWTFSDPDVGNTQSAFQVVIKKQSDDSLVHDTGKVVSAVNTYTLTGNPLSMNTLYKYTVTVWDNADASTVSAANYFMPSNAPIVTPVFGNVDPLSLPTGTSLTPRLSWFYSDPENHVQTYYEVDVFRAADHMKVLGSGVINSAVAYYDVPAGILVSGETYYWKVRVIDNTGLDSPFSNGYYFLTNNPPGTLSVVSPSDTYRTSSLPVFTATIGDDPENNSQHFKIEIAEDHAFTTVVQIRTTETARNGWEVKTAAGDFGAMPADGVDSTFESGTVRYTWSTDLEEGKTYYWRMAAIDVSTGAAGVWTPTRSIRCGDVLQFLGKTPISTTAPASRIVFSAMLNLPTDGDVPAAITIEACNNGHDAEPAWEDCTEAYLGGQYHRFTNTVKEAGTWAVNYRVTIEANDSLGPIEFDAIGLNFD